MGGGGLNGVVCVGRYIHIHCVCTTHCICTCTPHTCTTQARELDRVACEVYAQINRHLMDVLLNKKQFEKHCTAIKRYLLLGQGDFIQVCL